MAEVAGAVDSGELSTRMVLHGSAEARLLAESFNHMLDRLEDAFARQRGFVSDASHELRTPLTALVGEASLLADHLDAMPAASRRPAELLIADVGRLRRLVEDLMEISRFDAGRESVQAENVDLGSLAATAIRARGWEGHVRLDADEVVITSDPRRLERIVANLVGNALDHGGHGVVIRVARDGTGAFVEVSDRGPGIPPEHLSHLFERFYKADASRSGRGTGLGLAIAQENARLLGGEIEVWSEPGEGSRFTLRLPSSVVVTEPLRTGDFDVSHSEEHAVRQKRRRSP
jgi:two-component system sensor histidine kinase MtrB